MKNFREARQAGIRAGKEEMANEATLVDDPWTEESVWRTHKTMQAQNWALVRAGKLSPHRAVMNHIAERAQRNEMLSQIRARPTRY